MLHTGNEPGYYGPAGRGIALPQKQLRFVAGIHQAGLLLLDVMPREITAVIPLHLVIDAKTAAAGAAGAER